LAEGDGKEALLAALVRLDREKSVDPRERILPICGENARSDEIPARGGAPLLLDNAGNILRR